MSLIAVFGIGIIEIIIILGLLAVVGAVIVGVIVATVAANRGKDDRRQ
ncbi:MAG: hypothetical protein IAF94_26960 [Pirellulaceae bacterium]|nr:hypothetical protein [Pirellulaceae bacterium]